MRTNTELQLYPLLRIAVMLVAGILIGKITYHRISTGVWMILALVFLLFSVWLLYTHRKGNCLSERNAICCAVVQTCFIFITVFSLGAWTSTMTLKIYDIMPATAMTNCHAIVISIPVKHGKTERCDLLLADGPFSGKKIKASFLDTQYTRKEGVDASHLRVGEGLETYMQIESSDRGKSSGNFDYSLWLKIHDFIGTAFLTPNDWRIVSVDLSHLSYYQRTVLAALQLRQHLVEKYVRLGISGQEEAVIAAMTLGDKSGISKSTANAYSISGASHILSLSGLHLGIIYGILVFFFGGRNCWWNQILILLAIWSFVILVGSGSSVVRSAVMISIYALITLLNRDKFSLNTWSLALIIMLFYNPLYLFDVGFEMSFMAVLGILLGVKLFPVPLKIRTHNTLLTTVWEKLERWAWGFLIVSISAQLWTSPLVAYYFGRFSCYFLLTNIIVIPLAYLAALSGGSRICIFSMDNGCLIFSLCWQIRFQDSLTISCYGFLLCPGLPLKEYTSITNNFC
ncbi:MAG: ComEC/Rec2 family competence protein [Prevotella sp.]|jgi:competence protein ComEC|nr:ComEC/Rec2 family competence protein [Prevotella sp.]